MFWILYGAAGLVGVVAMAIASALDGEGSGTYTVADRARLTSFIAFIVAGVSIFLAGGLFTTVTWVVLIISVVVVIIIWRTVVALRR